ncbi:hypothetical protein KC730_02325 [Candidatus Kaiserbacteria bacterium]|nr:hypothetical protein [Candidatus Kaiserbacteria bacterium]
MSLTEVFIFLFVLVLVIFVIFEVIWITTRAKRAVRAGEVAVPASQKGGENSLRVLVVGDSTAFGTGASAPEFSMVGRLIADFPNLTVVNAAENALNVNQVRKKMQSLESEKFDIIIIHVGGVDTLAFTSAKKIRKELQNIFSCANKMQATSVVLVSVNNVGSIPLFHFPINKIFRYRSLCISQLCHEESEKSSVVHVPLYAEKKEEPLYQNGIWHLSPDSIHPNDLGYEIWYKKVKLAVSPHIFN